VLVGRSCFELRNSENPTSVSQRHFLKCIDKDIDSRIKFATEMLIRSMQYMIGPSQCGLPTRGRWMMERVLNGFARHETPRHRLRGFAPRLSQEETGFEGFGCSAEAFVFFAHSGGESYSIQGRNLTRTQISPAQRVVPIAAPVSPRAQRPVSPRAQPLCHPERSPCVTPSAAEGS
jgi:hypothetical protein